jgi:hypothetical protein
MHNRVFKPHFRHLSTASEQEFHRLLHRESAEIPRFFRTICTRSSPFDEDPFSSRFAELFRNRLADSAEKKWRKESGDRDAAEKAVAESPGRRVAGFPRGAQPVVQASNRRIMAVCRDE